MTVREDVEAFLGFLPKLRAALTQRETVASAVGFVTGGSPSYELVSLSVEALLADVRREVDEFEQDLRNDLGFGWRRVGKLEDALARLPVVYEAAQERPQAAESAARARVGADRWVKRAERTLGLVRAPYPLLWPDGLPVICPVIEWRGQPIGCDGPLFVHRNEFAVPNAIKCSRFPKVHGWASGPAWLRLGALLGGVA